MLPEINRIKKKKDFDIIFKKGKSLKTSLLVFKILNNDLGKNRFGFIISKKVSKKAVIRNKVRRQLAEILKDAVKENTKGKDIILITCPGIEKKSFLEIKESVNKVLNKLYCYVN